MTTFAQDCTKYLQLHAKQARLNVRLGKLRERIVPELREGKHSPRDLPYLLALQKRVRTLSDWKDELRRELEQEMTPDEAAAHMVGIQAGFPQEESEALVVEINKSYAAGLK